MKIQSDSNQPRDASALIAVLLLAVVVAGALAYYLALVSNECTQVFRSQTWNASLMMAEAGEEEAMAEINVNEGNFTLMTNWIPTAVANGWIPVSAGANVFYKHHVVDPIGYYDVLINATDPYDPTITVQGTAYWNWSQAEAPHPMLAQAGVTTSPSAVRRVQVKTTFLSLFSGALIAKGVINLNGNNITSDSYDSSDPTYSYWSTNNAGHDLYGLYTNNGVGFDPKRKANGDVQTDAAVIDSIDVGNADVYGHLDTGPGGTVYVGSNGSVGNTNFVPARGIQSGYVQDDMNVQFPDVTLPAYSWTSVSGNSISGPGYYSQDEITGDFSITAPSSYTAANPAQVVLYLPNGINLEGSSAITIATNVSVVIYAGNTLSDGGKGTINNLSQYARSLTIFGLPSLTSISIHGNGQFYGCIYAPEANAAMKGGGNSGGFNGSLVANTITLTGNSTFSYDEALKKQGYGFGFVPTSWQEVTSW